MVLKKFVLPPDERSYKVTDGEETLRVQLDGGKGRYRKDMLNSTSEVKVKWTFTKPQYEYFRAFYKGTAQTGAKSFLIDLLMDEASGLQEVEANFIPGKVSLSRVRGLSFEVTANLEVKPVEVNEAYYDFIVFTYENFGDDNTGMVTLLNRLAQFNNVDLPAIPVWQG